MSIKVTVILFVWQSHVILTELTRLFKFELWNTLRWKNLEKKGFSLNYRDVIFFKKLSFPIVFRPNENKKPAFSNSSSLENVFDKLRGGLVWTAGLTVEIKLHFLNFSGVVGTGL